LIIVKPVSKRGYWGVNWEGISQEKLGWSGNFFIVELVMQNPYDCKPKDWVVFVSFQDFLERNWWALDFKNNFFREKSEICHSLNWAKSVLKMTSRNKSFKIFLNSLVIGEHDLLTLTYFHCIIVWIMIDNSSLISIELLTKCSSSIGFLV